MKARKIPVRMCIGCGKMKEKNDLLRLVNTEKYGVIPDVLGKLPGRGAYICPERDCVESAKRSKKPERVFSVKTDDVMYEEIFDAIKTEP